MDITDTKRSFFKKEKWLLLILAIILVVGIFMLWNATRFRVQNVFDALYLEVDAVSRGKNSVLLSITESAEADYDLGTFTNVQIPELNMWITNRITVDKSEKLWISFYGYGEDGKENITFLYDTRTRTIHGEESLDFLMEHFLQYYFKACRSARQDLEFFEYRLGDLIYVYSENVYLSH